MLTVKQAVRPIWLLAALLMMLDALTTYLAFTWPGMVAVEGNPIMTAGFGTFGVALTMTFKALVGILTVWVLAVRTERGRFCRPIFPGLIDNDTVRKSAIYTLCLSVLIMGLVVGNNLRALILMGAG